MVTPRVFAATQPNMMFRSDITKLTLCDRQKKELPRREKASGGGFQILAGDQEFSLQIRL
jgi:hypothetical protein